VENSVAARVSIMAPLRDLGVFRSRMDSGFGDCTCGKTRIKSSENASNPQKVVIRYAPVEHFYCSDLQGGFSTWQQA
jgi:hypothetical protein